MVSLLMLLKLRPSSFSAAVSSSATTASCSIYYFYVFFFFSLPFLLGSPPVATAHFDDDHEHHEHLGEENQEWVLKQLHVVTRHGSRLPLPKNSDSLDEVGGGSKPQAQLTELGKKQMYDLGAWIRARYGSNATTNSNDIFDGQQSNAIRLESSAYDRTIVSANMLALGLFNNDNNNNKAHYSFSSPLLPPTLPNIVNINIPPIYTLGSSSDDDDDDDDDSDITLRAYDKCPNGLRLSELYESTKWKELENDHMPLLKRLALVPQFENYAITSTVTITTKQVGNFDDTDDDDGDYGLGEGGGEPTKDEVLVITYIPLKDIWNVFDIMYVAKTECTTSSSSTESSDPTMQSSSSSSFSASSAKSSWCLQEETVLTELTNPEWDELQMLSHKAEFMKYGRRRRHGTWGDTSNDADIGKLIGGNLLLRIFGRMMKKLMKTSTATSEKFSLYSAHYPTIIGVVTALLNNNDGTTTAYDDDNDGEGTAMALITGEVIPNYSSALFFELYVDSEDNSKRALRILYKPGHGNGIDEHEKDNVVVVLLDEICSSSSIITTVVSSSSGDYNGNYGDDIDAIEENDNIMALCPLETLMDKLLAAGYSKETWCRDCGNDSAAFCARTIVKNYEDRVCLPVSASTRAGLAVIVVLLGVVCGVIITLYCIRRRARRKQEQQEQQEQQPQVHVATTKSPADDDDYNVAFDSTMTGTYT